MKDPVLHFFSMELGHTLGTIVGNESGVMLRGKKPHKPDFAYDHVRTHSPMIYTDMTEYIIVSDTKASLLHCNFSFQSSNLETL